MAGCIQALYTLSDKLRLHCKLSLPGVVWACKEKGAKRPKSQEAEKPRRLKTQTRTRPEASQDQPTSLTEWC